MAGYRPELALAIAGPDPAARQALIDAVVGADAAIMTIGIAAEAATAHALVRRTAPDVALIDVELPGGGGVSVARALRDELPACRVVLLGSDERAPEGEGSGAAGWLGRSWSPPDLVRVVRAVARRERVPHARWVQAALERVDDLTVPLDDVDRSILDALADGDDGPAVADALGLTTHEVGRRTNDALARLERVRDPDAMAAGYSGTPLVTKLGIKPGHRLGLLAAPEHVDELLVGLPADVDVRTRAVRGPLDVIVSFHTWRADFEKRMPALVKALDINGGLWIAWPKKTIPKHVAKVPTDMTEDVVREVALPLGLVDNKVCAIDETWSGLRVVWRRETPLTAALRRAAGQQRDGHLAHCLQAGPSNLKEACL